MTVTGFLRHAMAALFVLLFGVVQAAAQPERWKREGWDTDFSKSTIAWSEVLDGGPPRDGIPPIDDPKFVAADAVSNLDEREPVIALTVAGETRAYPLQVLTWHEIVNDTIGGKPVSVTYCPLCNAAIVFDRMLDGRLLDFGTSGKLRNSDLIMYDRQTQSWWQQFSGEAIAGALTGKSLTMLPSTVVPWKRFKDTWPEARVLVPNSANLRPYGRNPYVGYDSSRRPFLYAGELPDDVAPMLRVVVVRRDDAEPIIVTLNALREAEAMEIDGYVLAWTGGMASALDRAQIAEGRDVGAVSVRRGDVEIVHDVTFAFVAHAFHPQTTIRQR